MIKNISPIHNMKLKKKNDFHPIVFIQKNRKFAPKFACQE